MASPHPITRLLHCAALSCAFAFVFATVVHGAQVDDTSFSVKRGFFDAPFEVGISTKTADAKIRYTLDGSAPTANHGFIYDFPLIINRTTTLRAAAFKAGLDPTDVDTQTYIFLDDVLTQTGDGFPVDWGSLGTFGTEIGNHPPGPHLADYAMDPDVVNNPLYAATIRDDMRAIPTLSLVLDRDDFFSDTPVAFDEENNVIETRGIYPVNKGYERPVSAELILPDGSSGFQINCSIEIQGATSTDRWKTNKLSMRLKFKAPYGPSELDYPLLGDDATDSINTVILDSTNQQSWAHPVTSQQLRAQYIRDQFVGDLQNAAGGLAPHGRYAHVYIDGLYWGVYWMHEFIEEAFAVTYRGGNKEDYDILRHRSDNAIAGNLLAYDAMLATTATDLSIPANYAQMQQHLDMPKFADYMLINFYAGNADWAFQNWNATYDRAHPEKKWQFHNWDGEKTWQDVNDDNTNFTNPGAPTFIHQQLRASAEYRLLFADQIHRHFFNNGIMTPAVAAQKYLARLSQIDRAIVGESARWGDTRNPDNPPYTRATWTAERDRLINTYFPNRTSVVLQQLRNDDLYPDTDAPVFSMHGGNVATGFALTITNPNPGGTIFYTIDGSDPRSVSSPTYTSPVILNQSTRVKSRIFTTEWSALNEAIFTVPSALANLRVTEIMYNPKKIGEIDADTCEFIEIENTGATALQLKGVQFTEGIQFTFPAMTLAAGQRTIIANDSAAFIQRYGAGANIVGEYGGSLSNSGETIAYSSEFGEAIQSFTYDDAWYPSTDGHGFSLVIKNKSAPLSDWNLPTGWRASAYENGSPGNTDIEPATLRITEINYHPELDEGDEFIEIRNIGITSINLNSAAITGAINFNFGNINLAPMAYIVVVRDQSKFVQRYGAGITIAGEYNPAELSNSGGHLSLMGPQGEILLSFDYDDDWYPETDGDGATLVINSDTQSTALWNERSGWHASSGRHGSPGLTDPAAPPALRITEIMYNSPEPSQSEITAGFDNNDDFDFLELQNTGNTPINLQGYTISNGVGYTFGAVILQPAEYIIVVEDNDAFTHRYGPGINVAGSYSQGLDNGTDELILKDNINNVIQDFSYDDKWHPSTDGDTYSLEIINPAAHPVTWNSESSWRPSGDINGNPGATSSAYYAWQWNNFEQSMLPSEDPDKDGINNLLEYAFNLDPTTRNTITDLYHYVTITEQNAAYPAISFQANSLAADVSMWVEVSDDLIIWQSNPALLETYIATQANKTTERFIVRCLDESPVQKFLRIRVELQ
jgi:hypothetical protein